MEIAILPQCLEIEPRFVRKGCAGQVEIAILPAIEPHFVQNGCDGNPEIAILHQFWRSNLISCERFAPDPLKSQFYVSFWQSNLISCERVARDKLTSQFYTSVFDDRTSFRAKRLRGTS